MGLTGGFKVRRPVPVPISTPWVSLTTILEPWGLALTVNPRPFHGVMVVDTVLTSSIKILAAKAMQDLTRLLFLQLKMVLMTALPHLRRSMAVIQGKYLGQTRLGVLVSPFADVSSSSTYKFQMGV